MANKTFQGRIVQKHDTKTNWDKATNFVPLKGEIIVYDDLKKIKIGDGTTKVGNLTFVSDLDSLATVAETGSYNDLKDKPTIPTVPTKVSAFVNDADYATKTELTNATAGITGAMHFIGTSTTSITDHGTQSPTINGVVVSTKTAGDTVIYNHLEFVWDGTKWEQLGDEGSYVLKTQQINGKALSGNITLNAADVGATSTTIVAWSDDGT